MAHRSKRLATMDYNDKKDSPQVSDKESTVSAIETRTDPFRRPSVPLPAPTLTSAVIVRVPATSDCGCWMWNMALLLFIPVFVGLFYHLSSLVTIQARLQSEVDRLEAELSRLRSTLHPPAYSMADFALDSQGGQVIRDLSSRTYQADNAVYGEGASWLTYNLPSNVIKGQAYPLTPGHCWALRGTAGQLSLSLARSIHITHVTIGHITKAQSLTAEIHSAPKTFTVFAQKELNGRESILGTFQYNENGDSFQTFKIENHTEKDFKYVRLEIQSNYGSPEYTCLYNFRVHGRIPETPNL